MVFKIPQVMETNLPDGSRSERILRSRPRLGCRVKNDGNRYEATARATTVHDNRFVFGKRIFGHDSIRNASALQGISNRTHGQGVADAKLSCQTATYQLGAYLRKYW